jgi:hypothetical protein
MCGELSGRIQVAVLVPRCGMRSQADVQKLMCMNAWLPQKAVQNINSSAK